MIYRFQKLPFTATYLVLMTYAFIAIGFVYLNSIQMWQFLLSILMFAILLMAQKQPSVWTSMVLFALFSFCLQWQLESYFQHWPQWLSLMLFICVIPLIFTVLYNVWLSFLIQRIAARIQQASVCSDLTIYDQGGQANLLGMLILSGLFWIPFCYFIIRFWQQEAGNGLLILAAILISPLCVLTWRMYVTTAKKYAFTKQDNSQWQVNIDDMGITWQLPQTDSFVPIRDFLPWSEFGDIRINTEQGRHFKSVEVHRLPDGATTNLAPALSFSQFGELYSAENMRLYLLKRQQQANHMTKV